MLRALEFDHVLDYQREDFTRSGAQNGRRYDLILDVKTNRPLSHYLRVLEPGGAYVTVGGEGLRVMQAMLLGPLLGAVTKKRVRLVMMKANKDLGYLSKLYEAGKLKPIIDGRYRLEQTPEAMRYFGEGRQKGKVVITVVGDAGAGDREPGSGVDGETMEAG